MWVNNERYACEEGGLEIKRDTVHFLGAYGFYS
jgi:hypothetical protein